MISTQESTIPTTLSSLCSITLIYQFSSLGWLCVLNHYVAGDAISGDVSRESSTRIEYNGASKISLFDRIVHLRVGAYTVIAPARRVHLVLTLSIAHSPFSPPVTRPWSSAHPFLTRATPTRLLVAHKPYTGELVVGWATTTEFIFNDKFDSLR